MVVEMRRSSQVRDLDGGAAEAGAPGVTVAGVATGHDESDVFNALAGVLTDSATSDATPLSDSAVTAELTALRRLVDIAQAAYLSRLATFHHRNIAEKEMLSTRSWARHHLRVAPAETSRNLAVIDGLGRLPMLASAFAAGHVSYPHAHAIIDAGPRIGWDSLAAAENELLNAAMTDDPTCLRRALRALGDLAETPRERRRRERRDTTGWLTLSSTFQDLLAIDGTLSPEDGAVVTAAIDAYTCPAGADDARHIEQRRADAFVELCRRTLQASTSAGAVNTEPSTPDTDAATDDDQHRPLRRNDRSSSGAHLVVITDLDTLTDGHTCCPEQPSDQHTCGPGPSAGEHSGYAHASSGDPSARGGPALSMDSTDDADGPRIMLGETSTGTILSGTAVRRLACDATITRVVLNADGAPLDVGRSRRTVTSAQRHALRLRDKGCRFPGCHRPFEWTDAHHLTWWSHGGATAIDNLILLCRRHHRAVHEGGWRILVADPQSNAVFIDPDGVRHDSRPPPTTRELTLTIHAAGQRDTSAPSATTPSVLRRAWPASP